MLLLDAMRGDSTRFTRQDGVEETWRIFEPLLERAAAGAPLRAGQLGPEGGRRAARRTGRTLARAVGPDSWSPNEPARQRQDARQGQSQSCVQSQSCAKAKAAANGKAPAKSRGSASPSRASIDGRGPEMLTGAAERAAMSPFPPIADYAFLSNCHTGALVAPDGAIDWLCVPRFDSPSVFGTLLDRQAGSFRFGPFGINVPSARIYEPGTNMLADDLEDADRLGARARRADARPPSGRGPHRRRTRARRPTTTPTTCSCAWSLCLEDEVEMELTCEPVFDYGREPGDVDAGDDGPAARTRAAPA